MCHHGTQTCVTGRWAACEGEVLPTAETCNGLDDDCDGEVDDGVGTTWTQDLDGDGYGSAASGAPTVVACAQPVGYAGSANDCDDRPSVGASVHPGAQELCDAAQVDENCDGAKNEGCGCSPVGGSVACCSGRGTQACEGLADGGSALAACTATSSLEVCNGVDDDCDGQVDEAGPGLCPVAGQRCTTGACACPSGQSVCNGQCKALTTEVCNGVDDDCDGQVDEGLTIACLPDADGDRYAGSSTATQQCPDAARSLFGGCPVGYVSAAASLGVDCDDHSATTFRTKLVRADADGDRACVGAALQQCTGTSAPSGQRFSEDCSTPDDCNDHDASLFALASVRADADKDAHCVGDPVTACVGTSAPAGKRFVAECGTDDCDDADATAYRMVSVRADADGDGYCAPGTAASCIGATPPKGLLLPGDCAGDDCKDSNALATTTCVLSAGYTTSYASKACAFAAPTETFTVSATNVCPLGFTLNTSTLTTQKTSGGGTCRAQDQSTLVMSCVGLEGAVCRVVGDCYAL